MGVSYDASLIIGWSITIPDDTDSDDFLDPLCKKYGIMHDMGGNAFSGYVQHYLIVPPPPKAKDPTPADIVAMIQKAPEIEARLRADGVDIGPFIVQAIGMLS